MECMTEIEGGRGSEVKNGVRSKVKKLIIFPMDGCTCV